MSSIIWLTNSPCEKDEVAFTGHLNVEVPRFVSS